MPVREARVKAIAGALEQYLSSAAPRLRNARVADARFGSEQSGNLRSAIGAEEQSSQFRVLCRACLTNVTVSRYRLSSSSLTQVTWARALGAYLRNSGAYLSVADSAPVDHDTIAARLMQEAARTKQTVTYHAMLEGVSLDGDEVSWKRYRLIHLDSTALKGLLSLRTRALFFDEDQVDLHKVPDHWFVVASEQLGTGLRGELQRVARHLSNRLDVHPTAFPAPVEDALATLALYDWQPEWHEHDRAKVDVSKQLGWMGFRVPVVFETSDDVLSWPRRVPDTSQVAMIPVPGPEGEDIGEKPEDTFLELDAAQTRRLEEFLGELQICRDNMPHTSRSNFLHVATDAILKAILSDGLEQVLWQIIAVEAVFGENRPGESTELLARRVAGIIAAPGNDREGVRAAFGELYGFRSDLVHGRQPRKGVFRGHLRRARELALPIVVWGLRTFADLQTESAASHRRAPKRRDLLELADAAYHNGVPER